MKASSPPNPVDFSYLDHETPAEDLAALKTLATHLRAKQLARTGGPVLGLEVGSWTGGSARVLAPQFDRLYCVDHFLGNVEDRLGTLALHYGPRRIFEAFCSNMGDNLFRRVFPCVGQSHTWAKVWPATLPLDFVFIDASHGYDDVKADVLGWRPHLREGGLLVLHDAGVFEGVDRVLEELLPHHRRAGRTLAYEEVEGSA